MHYNTIIILKVIFILNKEGKIILKKLIKNASSNSQQKFLSKTHSNSISPSYILLFFSG